jgi:hypothetical protein
MRGYLYEPRVWIVEAKFLGTLNVAEKWAPTCSVGLTREDARRSARKFHGRNSDVLTRVRRYVPGRQP